MKKIIQFVLLVILACCFTSISMAANDETVDIPNLGLPGNPPRFFGDQNDSGSPLYYEGFIIFPGIEIGMGSGTLSAAASINIGYQIGWIIFGTALKGQVININDVNYQFMPYTFNFLGLSYSRIPETGNNVNDLKLEGWSLGYARGAKITVSLLTESGPGDVIRKEFLMFSIGLGF